MGLVGYQLYVNARLNFYFFRAHGYGATDEMRDAYFDYVLSSFTDNLPYIFVFVVAVFFVGLYISVIILRPFKNIGDYSVNALVDQNTPYQVEQFAGHRLVTRFSELFFEFIRTGRTRGHLEESNIPPQYMGIHGPIFDGAFLFHFSFYLLIMTLLSVVAIVDIGSGIHQNTVQLAIKTLKVDPAITVNFFSAQSGIVEELWVMTALVICILNLLLAIHLYNSVSGAAFGIFATMRSFMKGNYSARVHLVGYGYLRESTRQLNKYLDWVQKNLTKPSRPT